MITPPRLQPGDLIGLMSPSRNLSEDWRPAYRRAFREIEDKFELQVKEGKHVWAQHYYAAGTAKQRADDFHELVRDEAVKAIIMTVGGKSAVHMLRYLDWDLIRQHPKIIAGMSDAATLLNPISRLGGLVTYYGVDFVKMWGRGLSEYEVANIKATWFDGDANETVVPNPDWQLAYGETRVPVEKQIWECLKPGRARGQLVGGTLGRVMLLDGTEYGMDYQDNILMIEGYAAKDNSLHAALEIMRLRGVFDQINGLVIGYIYNSLVEDLSRNRPYEDLIAEVTEGYDFPVLYVPDIGQHVRNLLMPIGLKVEIDAEGKSLQFEEPTVYSSG